MRSRQPHDETHPRKLRSKGHQGKGQIAPVRIATSLFAMFKFIALLASVVSVAAFAPTRMASKSTGLKVAFETPAKKSRMQSSQSKSFSLPY